MAQFRVTPDVQRAFVAAVVKKHGKLRGALLQEVDAALSAHVEKLKRGR